MAETIRGKGVISGIAMGKIMLAGQNLDGYLVSYQPESKETEQQKATAALTAVAEILRESIERLQKQDMTEQAAIMEAHRMMVQDPMMAQKIEEKLDENASAPHAVLKAAEEQAQMFESMEDEYFAARAVDLRDVGKRVAKYILGVKEPEIGDEKVILCGREIEPSVIAGMPTDKIAGVLLGSGSTTAHAVIIAKARAIPTIVGLNKEDRIDKIADGDHVVIDGEAGQIVINPTEAEMAEYNEKIKKQQEMAAHYAQLKDLPAVTTDGVKVDLMANIGTHMDVDNALTYGAEGVGLFRSEFVFMGRQDIPNEEDQFKAYKEAVEKCGGNLCVIRTMDIGGDKPLPYLNIPAEENPFLGYRAVRISLQRKDLFLPQLKAILRAGKYGKVGIMVPMIINVAEFKKVKELIEEAKLELTHEGKAFADDVQVGIMVETPAAAIMTPVLAKYVDFFSIGTNDLVQYTLACDRGNASISYLYNHFNPAVLTLIQRTITSARENGIWAGMCGEMASDPNAAVLLMAMGISELSMSAPSIPRVKEKIRNISSIKAKEILADVMKMEDGDEIKAYLAKVL
ncbi:phosphoenolpyruvate--protein phosphotransferase [Selenomonas caprae]|jgi:phosphotransferase system enzyme I (PtsI)|uniref:Phosphoenolpyruvate-protein phosphotransferase n=2 Tax=Selenomonas TaxID=970 RepID=A0A1I3EFB5_SELRU|nr:MULTISPECIES: phosphoenolpyruvate--protein phosphotransferase [Selenomonas]MBE6074274.1 phosphoenolpyruvate--protein phosphotransferase [Selenomonas ruminantium]TYZ29849.1 phosphoenolpyruvate--protein phosphotransferase [Selenomonas caprae]SFH97637.1 phosphotransferase system, enzyme I, PtsI [Selenomonas ruminantium]